jgi:ribosome-binding factor A
MNLAGRASVFGRKRNIDATMKSSYRTPKARPHRVAELLRERLALILLHKCADPRLKEITLTEVEMSPDLKQARVFYVVREKVDRDQVSIALDKALGFIKQEVAKENLFRLMPEFFFQPDTGLDRAAHLEELFKAAKVGPGSDMGSDS